MTNSRKQFLDKRQKEEYHKLAKNKQVRARSYFKLEQIHKKYNIFNDNTSIIDLGCAPGGWLEYIDKTITNGRIVGIDLLEVKKHNEFSEKVMIIQDDFDNIDEYINENFDLVLSDMAPEFSGDSRVDRGKTHKLNIKVLDFAKAHLKEGGKCVFKSFEGEDLENVRKYAKKIFNSVKEFKPKSSQSKSAEMFMICSDKRQNI